MLLKLIKAKNKRIKTYLSRIKELKKELKKQQTENYIAIARAEKARLHYNEKADDFLRYAAKIKAHIDSQEVINFEIMQKAGINIKHNDIITHDIAMIKKSINKELLQ
jgi:hypothetical protein